MTKLWIKIGKMRIEANIKINDIADNIDVCRQTVSGWRKRKPQKEHASRLVRFYPKYITMKDCGH